MRPPVLCTHVLARTHRRRTVATTPPQHDPRAAQLPAASMPLRAPRRSCTKSAGRGFSRFNSATPLPRRAPCLPRSWAGWRSARGSPAALACALADLCRARSAVALFALLLPVALRQSVPLLAWAYADGKLPLRFALTPRRRQPCAARHSAAAMGATFPSPSAGGRVRRPTPGVLYAANTAGAALGAIAAGFWLIPRSACAAPFGSASRSTASRRPARCGFEGNPDRSFLSPRDAWNAPRRKPRMLRDRSALRGSTSHAPKSTARVGRRGALRVCRAVYEVAWTRLLALVIGPTTYAFATMAAAFISGLAIGSAAGTRIARARGAPDVWLAAMLIACALSATVAAWFAASRLPLIVAAKWPRPTHRSARSSSRRRFASGCCCCR